MDDINILDLISILIIYYIWRQANRTKYKSYYLIFGLVVCSFLISSYYKFEMIKLRDMSKSMFLNDIKIPCESFLLLKSECMEFNRIIDEKKDAKDNFDKSYHSHTEINDKLYKEKLLRNYEQLNQK